MSSQETISSTLTRGHDEAGRAKHELAWMPVGLLAVAVALFCPLDITGDGTAYFQFLQRIFGDSSEAVGWVFGLAIANAPFYAVGKVLDIVGVHTIDGHPTTEALVALGGNMFMLASVGLTTWMLGALRLPARAFAVLAAVIGSPLLYYGLFLTSGTHAAETFLVTAAVALLLAQTRHPHASLALTAATAAVLGLATATRYSLAAMVGGLALTMFLYRRWRHALIVMTISAATFGLAYLAPLLTGSKVFAEKGVSFEIGFAPLSPLKMLFTNDRGLFIWSPVVLIGLIGFVRLIRDRVGLEREFLVQVAGMMIAYLGFHAAVPMWWQGGSFSSRFFTSIFPVVAMGLAECVAWRRALALGAATIAATWSLYLCLNVAAGIDVVRGDQREGDLTSATDVALFPVNTGTTWKVYLYSIYHVSHLDRG